MWQKQSLMQHSMKTADFDYHLPPELIAQHSVEPRDQSRLMVVHRDSKKIEHKTFTNILDYLQEGDLLVWNTSKVFKARLYGQLLSKDGEPLRDHTKRMQIFLVRPMENTGVWQVLAKPGKHVDHGTVVRFAEDFACEVVTKKKDGTILVQFDDTEDEVRAKANRYGHIPIPPYVKEIPERVEQYQTHYADPAKEGSVAAPTAGFHFTPEIIAKIKKKGIELADVTLHVGLGTFLPVKTEKITDHIMHNEWVEVSEDAALKINRAKEEGRRVIAVGTTTVRTLEGIAQFSKEGRMHPYKGDINLFITPGFDFQIVDALVTNFHLPKSTLLMLVAAFAGDREFMLDCYKQAVEEQYRFFSFGDAMFIV